MLKRIEIKEIKNDLSNKEFEFLINLIRKENNESIISSFSNKLLAKCVTQKCFV